MDEVDRIVAAWSEEAPDLDVEPMEIFSRISRLARHLDRARRDAFAIHGLDSWEFDVLAAMRREGPPYDLSPGQLVAQTLSTSGTMTNRIDRLAARGLVERHPDPVDRRGVRVRLLPEGKAVVEAALGDLMVRERALLVVLDAADRRIGADLLRRLLGPFETA
ncbi:MAG: MarR family winged helix-turn-helix transcriptional regulator [Propioniciclava sp.]